MKTEVHSWVGVGKEVGVAINDSMSAINIQANNFAQTPVGKLTAIVVVWKLIGDSLIGILVHISMGLLFMVVSLSIWLWSYKKTCMTRSVVIGEHYNDKGKKIRDYKIAEYVGSNYYISPREYHGVAIALIAIITLITLFTY